MGKDLYVLSYDHGGFVLWGEVIEARLDKVKGWLDKYPKFKVGLDYEAFTFDEAERTFPVLNEKIESMLKEYKGRFALGSTTYGQPLSLYISDESNIRQLTYAIKSNIEHFGETPSVYAISEFALNNQLPQLLKKCCYEAALMRTHVMNYGYQSDYDSAFGIWKGKDGTGIKAVPTYKDAGVGYTNCTLDNWILTRWPGDSQYSLDDFVEKFGKYEPLLASRYDDVCNGKEELVAEVENREGWKFILLDEMNNIFGDTDEILPTDDNDFHGRMPWGYIGNYIFNLVRKCEANAESADTVSAFCKSLGGNPDIKKLKDAWKNALVLQHHDVTICGLLDEAERFSRDSLKCSQEVINESMKFIADKFSTETNEGIVVFNPDSNKDVQWIDTGYSSEYTIRDVDCEIRNGKLFARVELQGLSCVKLDVMKKQTEAVSPFGKYDEKTGILSAGKYNIKLNENGICYVEFCNNRIIDNGDGALFRGYVENVDCMSKGDWDVQINPFTVIATHNGKISSIPFTFTMIIDSKNPRIECKATFEMNGEKVGRTGITKGIHTDFVVNGSVHEEKLRFVMNLCVDNDRKTDRDLPFAIAEWDQQICEPETFWYEGAKVLVDHKVSKEKAFNYPVYLQGINWASVYDDKLTLAVLNRGCIGNVLEGNTLSVPLIYANEYMQGTRMLNGEYHNEFALLPQLGHNALEIHRSAKAYNHPFITAKTEIKKSVDCDNALAVCNDENNTVVVTDVSPVENGIEIRLCNYSDKQSKCSISVLGCNDYAETNLLGDIIEKINPREFAVYPWEVKTFICK